MRCRCCGVGWGVDVVIVVYVLVVLSLLLWVCRLLFRLFRLFITVGGDWLAHFAAWTFSDLLFCELVAALVVNSVVDFVSLCCIGFLVVVVYLQF